MPDDQPVPPDDQPVPLEQALDQVVAAARAHLSAVQAADGAIDDAAVWRSYVALNNASYEYDQLLLDAYGEVTPWDTEAIEPPDAERAPGLVVGPEGPVGELRADPYPAVVSVRQRRDYRVPGVAALLAAAARSGPRPGGAPDRPRPSTVADAVLALITTGDGSLSSLDLPELEPLTGVVTVVEAPQPLDLTTTADPDLFRVGPDERQVGRRAEQPFGFEEPGPGGCPES